jgi:hypothetical protein
MTESEKAAFIKQLKADFNKLKWEPGYCRVDGCPTEGKITDVAQCKVCRQCQDIFDDNKNPARVYADRKKAKARLAAAKIAMKRELKKPKYDPKFLSNIKKFVRGDSPLAPVVQAVNYKNEVVAEDDEAREIYKAKSNL